jgi:hypothetical protein
MVRINIIKNILTTAYINVFNLYSTIVLMSLSMIMFAVEQFKGVTELEKKTPRQNTKE